MDAPSAISARLRFRHWLMLLAAMVFIPNCNEARGQVSREYELKAVFLYNFAVFTDWPAEAFAEPETPLVIGILGKDPLGAYLEEAVRGEKVNNRSLLVRSFSRIGEVKTCHILFISGSEARRLPEILDGLRGKSILTVSDIENFTIRGGMVRFLTVNNKLRLRINVDALKAARLTMSSKVLRAAEIDHAPNK